MPEAAAQVPEPTAELELNRSLQLSAGFAARMGATIRRSLFRLEHDPAFAAWLAQVLAWLAAPEGADPLTDPCRPGLLDASTQERLIACGALCRDELSGRVQISRALQVQVQVSARVWDGPCRVHVVDARREPVLACWLLALRAGESVPGRATLDSAQLAWLQELGVLVSRMPAPPVTYPLAPAELVQELGDEARAGLCSGAPLEPAAAAQARASLPPNAPIAEHVTWLRDGVTGLIYATAPGAEGEPEPPPQEAARRARWKQNGELARATLQRLGYALLRETLTGMQLVGLRGYARALLAAGYFPALGDGQVRERSALYNEPVLASLHPQLARLLSALACQPLEPSYCYLSHYAAGAILERHIDRAQCAWNMSLALDMHDVNGGEPDPWPLVLDLEDGRSMAFHLSAGDALVYPGARIYHYRPALPAGQRALICFFHFVPAGFAGPRG